MSTPLFWILLPALISVLSIGLLRYPRTLKWGGLGFSLALGLSAALLPINQGFNLVFWEVQISDQLLVFGRRFVLAGSERPVVILLFLLHAFWLLLFDPDDVPVYFVPFSLAGIVLILTAFAVDPIFYGALFFAFLALINVVMLSPPGSEPTPGALRLLIYQILGMLFILFAAWLASWIDLNRGDQLMLARTLLILALGFSFLLAIFPFFSWILMIGERNHPFLAGYLFNSYFLGVFLFGSRFLTEGGWLGGGVSLQIPLQIAGVMMLCFGGILAVVARHLGRISAALVIAEIGRSLLSFSLFAAGFPIYFGLVLIQTLALGVWSLSLSNLQKGLPNLEIRSAAGAARQWPLISSGLLVGYFTLAGLPLLAGFPIYLALGSGLSLYPDWINIGLILGSLGALAGGFRLARTLLMDAGRESAILLDSRFERVLVISLNVILLTLGMLPQLVFLISRSISAIALIP